MEAGSRWKRVVDTGLDSPGDIADPGHEATLESASYAVRARSVVVLAGRAHDASKAVDG